MKKENYFKIILTSLIFALFIQMNLFSQSEITSLKCYSFDTCVYKGYYSKDPKTQIEYYSQALLLWKDAYGIKIKSAIYVNRGSAYKNLKQYDKAINDYNKAIELNPADADAYYDRGIIYYYLKQYNKAINDYSKAIELKPNFAYAYNNRGFTYLWLGKCEKAKSDFDKAIEISKR
jgi:tetratricopeptide (TPR) repeat protein